MCSLIGGDKTLLYICMVLVNMNSDLARLLQNCSYCIPKLSLKDF